MVKEDMVHIFIFCGLLIDLVRGKSELRFGPNFITTIKLSLRRTLLLFYIAQPDLQINNLSLLNRLLKPAHISSCTSFSIGSVPPDTRTMDKLCCYEKLPVNRAWQRCFIGKYCPAPKIRDTWAVASPLSIMIRLPKVDSLNKDRLFSSCRKRGNP